MRTVLATLLLAGCGQSSAPATAFGPTAFPMTALPMTAFPATAAAPAVRDLASAQLGPADVAPACQPTADATGGSLHANVLFEVSAMPTPTGGKTKQGFVCAGVPATVFFYAFATDRDASDAAGIAGASLWGGPAPTREHTDEVMRSGPVLAVVSSTSPDALVGILGARRGFAIDRGGGVAAAPADLEPPALQAMRAGIDCASPVEARYCAAMDRFAAGSPATPWPTPMLGSSLHVERPAGRANAEETSHLIVRADGVRYGEITPSSPEEAVQIQGILVVLRSGAPVPPTDPVYQYVQTLASSQVGTASVVGRSLFYHPTNAVYLRDAGTDFVVLEVADSSPQAMPFFVGIFPKR